MTDVADVWATCRANLRKQVPEPTWNTWLAQLVLLDISGSKFVVGAPNSLVLERVATRFKGVIADGLAEVTCNNVAQLELIVNDAPADGGSVASEIIEPNRPLFPQGTGSTDIAPVSSEPARQSAYSSASPASGAEDHVSTGFSGRSDPARNDPGRSDRRVHPMLNPRYTFEAYVIGASNRFAQAAAQRVAEEPAKAYNPLFIYGASGLGKTHMLHAIGHYDHQNFPHLNVCYVSTETFLNEFIDAIRTHGQTAFKRRYRAYDVLLVDDIQLLEGKKETQEEFFYTFNSFYEAEKQIVISSDRHPRSIATLEDRLRSRFESGLITDIQPPELETRLAILRKKSEGEKVEVPEEVLELIATYVKDNIRELEGALIRVSAFASIHQIPVTVEAAQKVLKDIIDASAPRQVTPEQILEATAKAFDLTIEQICGPSRRRPLVAARQTAMYLFRSLTDYSYPAIAHVFGDRDHTTVMHAQKKVARLMRERRQVYEQVTDLIHSLTSGD
ncbi:MAG TPA: chromosomal replication initiator protein DnaA [Acidimicrobiales bacterium]|nr:chromosomal replication initiator protein DnaA [Acidimicrobiales bacterium]